jgi:hypothetical protein
LRVHLNPFRLDAGVPFAELVEASQGTPISQGKLLLASGR